MPIQFFDSLTDFRADLPPSVWGGFDGYRARQVMRREPWSGNQTLAEAKENLFKGDPEALRASEKLMNEVEGEGLELAQSYWDNDRTGFIPCIPSFLAGSPESMRRLQEMQTDTTPIKIFVDVCLSAGFNAEKLARRGTAILSLARKLQAIRPVEMSLYASMDGKDGCAIPVIRLETNPLDLSSASYAMANPGFLRQLCFAWGDKHGFSGGWAWGNRPEKTREKLYPLFGISEKDLVINGAYADDELMKNPVQWVNNQIRKYAEVISDND